MVSTACNAANGTGAMRIRQTLQPGTYWAALTGNGNAGGGAGPYTLRMRDYAPVANSATLLDPVPTAGTDPQCGATGSTTIVRDVVAGTPYYAVVKGASAGQQGNYKLTVENLQLATQMGCNAEPASPDAFYKFSLSTATHVGIRVGGTADTVIAVYNASAT